MSSKAATSQPIKLQEKRLNTTVFRFQGLDFQSRLIILLLTALASFPMVSFAGPPTPNAGIIQLSPATHTAFTPAISIPVSSQSASASLDHLHALQNAALSRTQANALKQALAKQATDKTTTVSPTHEKTLTSSKDTTTSVKLNPVNVIDLPVSVNPRPGRHHRFSGKNATHLRHSHRVLWMPVASPATTVAPVQTTMLEHPLTPISKALVSEPVPLAPITVAHLARHKPSKSTPSTTVIEPASPSPKEVVDPESLPLVLNTQTGTNTANGASDAMFRMTVGLLIVLALMTGFAKILLPRLILQYPGFFENLRRHAAQSGQPAPLFSVLKPFRDEPLLAEDDLDEAAENESNAPSEATSESVFTRLLTQVFNVKGNTSNVAEVSPPDITFRLPEFPAMQVLATTELDETRALHLVSVMGRQLVISSAPEGITLVRDLGDTPTEAVSPSEVNQFTSEESVHHSQEVAATEAPTQDLLLRWNPAGFETQKPQRTVKTPQASPLFADRSLSESSATMRKPVVKSLVSPAKSATKNAMTPAVRKANGNQPMRQTAHEYWEDYADLYDGPTVIGETPAQDYTDNLQFQTVDHGFDDLESVEFGSIAEAENFETQPEPADLAFPQETSEAARDRVYLRYLTQK